VKNIMTKKKTNILLDIDKFAINTGIPDLATNHDHYLYSLPYLAKRIERISGEELSDMINKTKRKNK